MSLFYALLVPLGILAFAGLIWLARKAPSEIDPHAEPWGDQ